MQWPVDVTKHMRGCPFSVSGKSTHASHYGNEKKCFGPIDSNKAKYTPYHVVPTLSILWELVDILRILSLGIV